MLGNVVVDMYVKCGTVCQMQSILENLLSRNVVSCNVLIVAYAKNAQGEQALDYFEQMHCEHIASFSLSWCVAIGAIEKTKELHDKI